MDRWKSRSWPRRRATCLSFLIWEFGQKDKIQLRLYFEIKIVPTDKFDSNETRDTDSEILFKGIMHLFLLTNSPRSTMRIFFYIYKFIFISMRGKFLGILVKIRKKLFFSLWERCMFDYCSSLSLPEAGVCTDIVKPYTDYICELPTCPISAYT